MIRLAEVRTGKARRLNETSISSAIGKTPREGKVWIGELGLEGDEQAQKPLHGGPDKAVLHYAAHHYAAWAAELPERAALFTPGGFGENLVAFSLDETNVCIGDAIRVGEALLQVAQPRGPCYKLNHRFFEPTMSRRVQESGRSGWYCRVLQPGAVAAGDRIIVEERPHPEWPVRRVQYFLYEKPLDREALGALAALPALAESLRAVFAKRLASSSVESWTRRLTDANNPVASYKL
jgi:MOSC domain-containing protein YiiM